MGNGSSRQIILPVLSHPYATVDVDCFQRGFLPGAMLFSMSAAVCVCDRRFSATCPLLAILPQLGVGRPRIGSPLSDGSDLWQMGGAIRPPTAPLDWADLMNDPGSYHEHLPTIRWVSPGAATGLQEGLNASQPLSSVFEERPLGLRVR